MYISATRISVRIPVRVSGKESRVIEHEREREIRGSRHGGVRLHARGPYPTLQRRCERERERESYLIIRCVLSQLHPPPHV